MIAMLVSAAAAAIIFLVTWRWATADDPTNRIIGFALAMFLATVAVTLPLMAISDRWFDPTITTWIAAVCAALSLAAPCVTIFRLSRDENV